MEKSKIAFELLRGLNEAKKWWEQEHPIKPPEPMAAGWSAMKADDLIRLLDRGVIDAEELRKALDLGVVS